jgi:hypothetical protein
MTVQAEPLRASIRQLGQERRAANMYLYMIAKVYAMPCLLEGLGIKNLPLPNPLE